MLHITREDTGLVAAVQGAVVEDSRDTLRKGMAQWGRKMHEQVWGAQTRKYERIKRMNNDEEIEEARRQWEQNGKKEEARRQWEQRQKTMVESNGRSDKDCKGKFKEAE